MELTQRREDKEHREAPAGLDGLSTEELAQRGLARMTEGAYITVTMLKDGGINMMPYTPTAARAMVPICTV